MNDFSLDRLIKDFDRELKDIEYKLDADTTKMLNDKKQSMVIFSFLEFASHNH